MGTNGRRLKTLSDPLGYRIKRGVITSSTNTAVQPEIAAMRVPGVTAFILRITTPKVSLGSDDDFVAPIERMLAGIGDALTQVMTRRPDHVINALSLEAFRDGLEGSQAMLKRLKDRFGVYISMDSNAILAALEKLSGIPGPLRSSRPTSRWVTSGCERIFRRPGTKSPSCTVSTSTHRSELPMSRAINCARRFWISTAPGPDSIVQVGTGFIMGALAAEAEEWLGKPVIAINTAWYWRALRACGISDRIDGFSHLLARY